MITLKVLNGDYKIEKPSKYSKFLYITYKGEDIASLTHSNFKLNSYIEGIYVDEEHRGKGLGRKLMEYFISFTNEKTKSKNIFLTSVDSALGFYYKLGFIDAADCNRLKFVIVR